MRPILTAGLVAAATVLGTWAAVPAAHATTATAATASAGQSASPLSHFLPGTRPGALPAARSVTYPDGVAPAATTAYDQFYDVSCLHAGDCLAVGTNNKADGGFGSPLAYLWTHNAWKATAVHLPAGATGGFLGSVSCKPGTPSYCVAVGGYHTTGKRTYPFATDWNGSTWVASRQPPNPSGDLWANLEWVSCRSSQDCVGVGSYTTNASNDIPMAETWNGNFWTLHRVPTPASPYVWGNVDAVSCPVAGFCLLGGYYAASNGYNTELAVRWDGAHFTQVTVQAPSPAVPFANFISGVSCTSSTSCAIDGVTTEVFSATKFSSRGYVEVLSGSAWKLTVPAWPHGQQSELIAVSCTSSASPAMSCVAAGGIGPFATTSTDGKAAVVRYNGSTWSVTTLAPPAGQGSSLNAVQCLTSTYCVAAGTEGPFNSTVSAHGLTGFYNGIKWTLVNTP